MTQFWVRLRYHATGQEATTNFGSRLARTIFLITSAAYIDVLEQGER